MKANKLEKQFLALYDTLQDAIFRHCYFRLYNRERAKEITQESFLKTWEALAKGQDIQNLRAFIYRVANNLIIDDTRKKKESSLEMLQEEGFEPMDHSSPDPHIRIDAQDMVLRLQDMPEEEREVLVMRYLDEMKPKEIAEILGLSQNVVSVRIHRALKKLHILLQKKVD